MANFSKADLENIIKELMGRGASDPLPLLFQKQIRELITSYNMSLLDIAKVLTYMVDIENYIIDEKYGIKPLIYARERALNWYELQRKEIERQKAEAKKITDNNIVFKIKPRKLEREIRQIPLDDIILEDEDGDDSEGR